VINNKDYKKKEKWEMGTGSGMWIGKRKKFFLAGHEQ
jgi:hypothetical protein